MQLDDQLIDEAVLALLVTFSFDGCRAWKGFSWDVMDRLHAQGLIDDPRSKAKSVYLSADAMERGRAIADRIFSKQPAVGG